MTNNYRGRSHDLGALNDIENASEQTKAYADMKAKEEVQKLMQKYAKNPAFLRLMALHLNGVSETVYSKHVQQLEKAKPENQRDERLKREITAKVMQEMSFWNDDNG